MALVEAYGVSRNTVRYVPRRLHAEGVVTAVGGRWQRLRDQVDIERPPRSALRPLHPGRIGRP
jgi:DNA-binding FadR family transcriptional regulator